MAKVTALWSSALLEVEHQYSHPGDDNSKQKAVLGKLAIKSRTIPAKGLLKLLTDLDVVHCIATACKHAVQWGSDAASLQAVLSVLGDVLQLFRTRDKTNASALPGMRPGGQVRASVRQQVERSGLLAEFAGLVRSTTEQLTAATSSSDGNVDGSSAIEQSTQLNSTLVLSVARVGKWLLCMWSHGIAFLSDDEQVAASNIASTTAAVLQLACAMLQAAKRGQSDVAQQEAGASYKEPSCAVQALHLAEGSLSHLYAVATSSTEVPTSSGILLSSTDRLQHLLQSEAYAPCLCLIASTASVAAVYKEQQQLLDAGLLQLWTGDSGGQQQLPSGATQLQVVVETLLVPSVLAYWPPSSLLHDRLLTLLSQHVPAAADAAGSCAADTAAAAPRALDATGPAHSPSSSSFNNAQDSNAGSTHDSTAAAPAVLQLPSTTASLLSPQAFLMPVLQEFERTVRTVARSAPLAANASLLQNALRSMATLCHGITDGQNDLLGGLLVDWACRSGCAELQQLCSLLVSMLKFGSKHMGWDATAANELRMAAAMGACSILVCGSSDDHAHNSSSRGAPASVPDDAFDSSLHSLHTFGRCCLHWAQQLQAEIPLLLHQRVAMLQGRPAERGGSMSPFNSACFDAADVCLEPMIRTGSGDRSLLEILVRHVQEGLESAAISPSGVSKQQLLSALDQLQNALPAASDPSTANPVPLVGLVRQLHSTGLAFTAI